MPPRVHTDTAFRFEVPDGWENRSIVVWSAPPSAAEVPPNVVVAYDRPRSDETLRTYVTRQVADLTRTAQRMRFDLRRDIEFAGRPAVEIVFEFETTAGTMRQRQIFALLPDGRVTSTACTARAADFAAADETFRTVLQSFRWTA